MSTRTSVLSLGLVALSSLALGGCARSVPQKPKPSAETTYYADIKPLIDERCTGCHHDGGIAPFALETYDQVNGLKEAIKSAVTSNTMPPWLADDTCADYARDRSLSEDEIQKLAGWVDGGAPAGDPKSSEPPVQQDPGLSRVDRTLSMPVDYTAQLQPDDYRCFLLDWPESETTFVTGFRANPGNPKTVHHVIAYLIPPEQVAKYEALDAQDSTPGYTCFGGPGGGLDAQTRLLGTWAPGAVGGDLPQGTGIKVTPGSKIALQVHYNTANTGPVPDRTSIDLRLDSSVEHEGTWQFFTNLSWVLGQGMDIPPMTSNIEHSYATDATAYISPGKPFLIHSVGLHMHTRGKSARLAIERAGSDEQCLLDIPQWNFHWQLTYQFTDPIEYNPGDKLSITCDWDNTTAESVKWGEGTGDEMCLGLVYYTLP